MYMNNILYYKSKLYDLITTIDKYLLKYFFFLQPNQLCYLLIDLFVLFSLFVLKIIPDDVNNISIKRTCVINPSILILNKQYGIFLVLV